LTDISEELSASVVRVISKPCTEKLGVDIGVGWKRKSPGQTNGRGENHSESRQSKIALGEVGTPTMLVGGGRTR
jgi:hypothetical protein